jgi:hypothetical protein
MPNSFEPPIIEARPELTEPDEAGAFFIRASAQRAEPLDSGSADIFEGLLMLLQTDDWKVPFVSNVLTAFRRGVRETPADVLMDLRQAAEQFEIHVEVARHIADNYSELLNAQGPASDVKLAVGSGVKKPVKRPEGVARK